MSDGKPITSSDDDKIGGTSGTMSGGTPDQGDQGEYSIPLHLLNSGADAPASHRDDGHNGEAGSGHDSGHDAAWDRVALRMRRDIGESAWRNWIKPLRFGRLEDGTLTLEASSTLARERVTSQYADRLRVISAAEFGSVRKIAISLSKQQPPRMSQQQTTQQRAVARDAARSEGDPIGAGLDPRYTFANFIVGKPNELAFAVARRTAESASVAFNPLFLYGGVGLGKTHLMHAVGNAIHDKHPELKVAYMYSQRFMEDMVRAIEHGTMAEFTRYYRSVDVLLMDDIQFLAKGMKSQEEFFHVFNRLQENGSQIVLTCDRYPKEIAGLEERLKSRFVWGMTAPVEAPELETRVAILMKKAEMEKAEVPHNAAFFIAERIRSNVRELEGALKRVIANATFTGRSISIEQVKDSLKDLIALSERQVGIENIQKIVADYYKIKIADLHSKRRNRSIARPRQLAMALAKELTTHSLPEIGDAFGGRDHTTLLHACRKIEELKESSRDIREDYNNLIRTLTA